MAQRETFARICERVCEEQGWTLLPTGVEVHHADGRHQIVSLEHFEDGDDAMVRLSTTIGTTRALSTERLALALQVNARLVHGALAVRDGELIMTQTLMLHDADPGEVRASVGYLAETADYYEKIFFGTDEN